MKAKAPDLTLLCVLLTLLGLGIVMVFSASSVESLAAVGNPYYFLIRQAIWASLGLVAMVVLMNYPLERIRRLARPFAMLTGFLLLAVLVPHVGKEIQGARRWIGVGSLVLQPSEIAKLALVLLFADTLSRPEAQPQSFMKGVLPHLGWILLAGGLIMLEPDLGTALCIAGTGIVMLWVAGAQTGQILGVGALGVPAIGLLILVEPYRLNRLLAFLHPQKDPLGSGYHIIQSLYALGSGGLFGQGLGRSSLKYFYLPEQHTDFIFAVLGEELGFLGALAVVVLFFIVGWRGIRTAVLAPDRFSSLLAAGLTTMILLQAFLNIAVVTASMPITGVPLPFISYGGSSLVFTLAGAGLLLNVSRHVRES